MNNKSHNDIEDDSVGLNPKNNRIGFFILAITIIVMVVSFCYFFYILFKNGGPLNIFKSDLTIPFLSVIIAVLSVRALILYLDGSKSVRSFDKEDSGIRFNSYFFNLLFDSYKFATIITQRGSGLKPKDSELVIQDLNSKDKDIVIESYRNKIAGKLLIDATDKLKKEISSYSSDKHLESFFSKIKDRLLTELDNQSKRGTLSLSLGIVTAFVGIGVLGYSVISQGYISDYVSILSHYIPRLSIVIVIEVFAYFFLKLYKRSLDEIKYFQNEITNIEMKFMSIVVARGNNTSESVLANLAEKLMNTERNYVLNKGQSTIFLEKSKLDGENNSVIIDLMADAMKSVSKKNE